MATDTDRLLAKIEEMLAVEAAARAELETRSRVKWLTFTGKAQDAHRPLLELVRALVAERANEYPSVEDKLRDATDAAIRAFLEAK